MPPNGNDMKTLRNWLLGILGTLLTTGIIAAVGFGWVTSKTVAVIQADMANHEATMLRVEEKLDNHIEQHTRQNGG